MRRISPTVRSEPQLRFSSSSREPRVAISVSSSALSSLQRGDVGGEAGGFFALASWLRPGRRGVRRVRRGSRCRALRVRRSEVASEAESSSDLRHVACAFARVLRQAQGLGERGEFGVELADRLVAAADRIGQHELADGEDQHQEHQHHQQRAERIDEAGPEVDARRRRARRAMAQLRRRACHPAPRRWCVTAGAVRRAGLHSDCAPWVGCCASCFSTSAQVVLGFGQFRSDARFARQQVGQAGQLVVEFGGARHCRGARARSRRWRAASAPGRRRSARAGPARRPARLLAFDHAPPEGSLVMPDSQSSSSV
jgi:hypothetical protein